MCADDLRDGDRLPERAAEAKDDGRDDTRTCVGKDDAPNHLPARAAERERPFLEIVGHALEELTAHACHDRDGHDRQDENRREVPEAASGVRAEERDESQVRMQPGLHVVVQQRDEDVDPPQPEDDARNRCQHLDERADALSQKPRREFRQEEGDSDSERCGQQQSAERGQKRPRDEIQGTEVPLYRVPYLARDEAESEV